MRFGNFRNRFSVDVAVNVPNLHKNGSIFLIQISSMTSSAEIFNELKNPQLGSSFGFAMTSSDLDGDEVDELLIGAPSWGEQQQGRVFIYSSGNFFEILMTSSTDYDVSS